MAAFFLLYNSDSVINQPKLFSSLLRDTMTRSFNGCKINFKRHTRALHTFSSYNIYFCYWCHTAFLWYIMLLVKFTSLNASKYTVFMSNWDLNSPVLYACKINEWTLDVVLSVHLPPTYCLANKTLPVSIEEPDQRIRWSRWKNQIILCHYLRNAWS